MFQPAKYKFRKAFKGKVKGSTTSGASVSFGSYGLKAQTPCRIKSSHIESARKTITRQLKRKGKMWIRIFPNVPVSKKPADVRMGKGKSSTEFWIFRVRPGKILFEIEGVSSDQAYEAFRKAATKLPLKCIVVHNNFGGIR